MNLTAEQLQENWEKLIGFIDQTFTGDKKDKLLKLYNSLEDTMITMPASGTEHFHSAYPGGYVVHIHNVILNTQMLYKLWERLGADMSGYTYEELMFVALNHDLGKVGDGVQEYYIPNTSEWHIKNRGEIYTFNPKLPYMKVADRSLFILQDAQIPMTQNEFIGIRIHDGVFEEANKSYWISYSENNTLRTNLPHIIQQADYMAYRIEWEQWKNSKGTFEGHTENHNKFKPKAGFTTDTASDETVTHMRETFAKLFDK